VQLPSAPDGLNALTVYPVIGEPASSADVHETVAERFPLATAETEPGAAGAPAATNAADGSDESLSPFGPFAITVNVY
jgi:hypothetical protein